MTHKFLAKNSRLPKYPPCPLLPCYERTPADRRVSTAFRRFAIPGPITRLPGFRKAPRFILSLLLSSSFLPSFANLVLLPFNSYGATLSPPLMNRWREREKGWWNRENLNFALCPATFSLFLLLARAQVFSSSFSVFFLPPSLSFFFLPPPSLPRPSAQISRHNRRSEPKLSILEINGIIIITSLLFLLSETMRNRERGKGERGDRTFIIFGKLVIGLASSTSEERSERGEVEGKGKKEIRKRKKKRKKNEKITTRKEKKEGDD